MNAKHNYETRKAYFETLEAVLSDRGYYWLTYAIDENAHALFIGCLATLKSVMIDYKDGMESEEDIADKVIHILLG